MTADPVQSNLVDGYVLVLVILEHDGFQIKTYAQLKTLVNLQKEHDHVANIAVKVSCLCCSFVFRKSLLNITVRSLVEGERTEIIYHSSQRHKSFFSAEHI